MQLKAKPKPRLVTCATCRHFHRDTTGLWSVHDKKEYSYTWGMTMDEALHYLSQQGVNPNDVTILN